MRALRSATAPLLFTLSALLPVLAVLAAPAAAHQQKEAITRVLFNPRTGNIEVMHRFILHDAEHASHQLLGISADLLGSQADRNRFEAYVHARFELRDQDERLIELTPVGNEIEHGFLWVYAEAPIPEGLRALTISHRALRDVWADQVNLVNVEQDASVKSALFSEGSDAITLQLK